MWNIISFLFKFKFSENIRLSHDHSLYYIEDVSEIEKSHKICQCATTIVPTSADPHLEKTHTHTDCLAVILCTIDSLSLYNSWHNAHLRLSEHTHTHTQCNSKTTNSSSPLLYLLVPILRLLLSFFTFPSQIKQILIIQLSIFKGPSFMNLGHQRSCIIPNESGCIKYMHSN